MERKGKDSRGFTLVEMLCATVILVLLGLLVNTGLNLAVKSYREVTAQSEVELLLSTLTNALTDELHYARDVKQLADGGLIQFHSHRYNYSGNFYTIIRLDKGKLYAGDYQMVPDGAYSHGTYEIPEDGLTITFNKDTRVFEVKLKVQQAGGGISAGTEFTVRCLNPESVPNPGETA